MKLSLAPMQGFSDQIYRSTLSHIGGVDVFYAPYIRVENGVIKPKSLADIAPDANSGMAVVPQVLTNNADELLLVADMVAQLGYTELNWNLGCPFPMVAKRRLGAGLLPYPETIDSILTEVDARCKTGLSVKMRLGYLSPDEIWPVLDVLNRHNIKEIILHPRIGKQMYNGVADRSVLPEIVAKSVHPVAYNGDICTAEQAQNLLANNTSVTHLMIGRGLLCNPFLALEIKGHTLNGYTRRSQMMNFVGSIAERQLDRLQGAGHFLQKMTTYWEYWSQMFDDAHRAFKTVKKCRSIEEYTDKVQDIVLSWTLAVNRETENG